MTRFQTLFGIKESQVKKTCLVMPLLRKDTLVRFGVKNFLRGRLYRSGNSPSFTLIHTGVGAPLLGDAVLYLYRTQCKNIILFGSCGSTGDKDDVKIGSLVTPQASYALESFSGMLLKDYKTWEAFNADKNLLEKFLVSNKDRDIKKVTCATLGSLKLEDDYTGVLNEKGIQIVDMECSSFFSASKYIKRRAMALFYVTDIINKKPFYKGLNPKEQLTLDSSIKSATNMLCEFIKKNLND